MGPRSLAMQCAVALPSVPLGRAESIHGSHECRGAAKQIGHLYGLVNLRFCSAGSTRTVGNIRYTIRMRRNRIYNHRHQNFILGGNSALSQCPFALPHIGFHELWVALLEGLDPWREGRLRHRSLLADGCRLIVSTSVAASPLSVKMPRARRQSAP